MDPAERLCVVGALSGQAGGRSLLLFAHPDTEPVRGINGWRHAPFAGEIEGDRLYGWGVADDLLGVATMICALMAVSSKGRRPRGTVTLASTPSKRNARGIVAVLDRGNAAGAAVYLHPAESGRGLRDIKALTSGLLRFQISVPGEPPDTHEPEQTPFHHLAVNPIHKAWLLVRALQALDEDRGGRVRHPVLQDAVGRSTNIQVAYIHGGDADHPNRISRTCVLVGSVTFPPHERMEGVQSEIVQTLEAASQADPWLQAHPPQLEWLLGVRGAEVSLGHPLYDTARRAIHAVTGHEPTVNALHASSDIRHPILHTGIPTVGYGPLAGDFSQAGGTDEWVDLEDYLRAIKVTGCLILDWCGVREAGQRLGS
jgi:acetylornithine deacetylase/succinyl-diaminopimelate desuccinylase-like protein